MNNHDDYNFDEVAMVKRCIVAIGGGEIGRPGYKVETTSIDKRIIALSNKKHPKLLFIPTASGDSIGYCTVVREHFGKRLGCKIDVLFLLGKKLTKRTIERKILGADIIYVGGGNTRKMIAEWKERGVDRLLKEAWDKGIVLSGLSAGAVCWFKHANSDSLKMLGKSADMNKEPCLGFLKSLCCPHYGEGQRKSSLKKMMLSTKGTAIAIDNCCAIMVTDDTFRVINSKKNANAHIVYYKGKRYVQRRLQRNRDLPLSMLTDPS